jgi:hypothetical protein
VPTNHPRIQVLRDESLDAALTQAAPYLDHGISAGRAVHELAVEGARHVAERGLAMNEDRETAIEYLIAVSTREDPAIDWDVFARLDQDAWRAE